MSKATESALLKQLKNPFDPKFIKWRVGATNADKSKGIALAYVDSREVMKRFDDVCGVGGWQDRLIRADNGFISEIDVKIDDMWVTRSNAAGDTKVEPMKGGASDAFKRTASKWGVGRYLYYLPNVWVAIKPQGNSFVLAEIPELPSWALPDAVERWEDVAELEDAANTAGADIDEIASGIITNLDDIRAAKNIPELDALVAALSSDEQLALANEINIKKRELIHDAEINSD